MIVLDASLAVKLVVDEPDSELADRWYEAVTDTVIAPDLLAVEVAQAVVRRINAREMMASQGKAALREWRLILESNAIELRRTSPLQVAVATDLAIALGHPVKDCIYLALAMEVRGDFVTCDAKFASKARSVFPAIKLLADHA